LALIRQTVKSKSDGLYRRAMRLNRTNGLRTRAVRGQPHRGDPSGDVVWFEPHEKHWHGASPTTAMTHIAIAEALDGKVVEWMEKVSDEYDAVIPAALPIGFPR
jgi:hypothetical protein